MRCKTCGWNVDSRHVPDSDDCLDGITERFWRDLDR